MADITLTGRVASIHYANKDDGYVVFTAGDVMQDGQPRADCKVVGRLRDLAVDTPVSCTGCWETKTFGGRPQRQFSATLITDARAASRPGIGSRNLLGPALLRTLVALTENQGHTTTPRVRLVDALGLTEGLDTAAAEHAIDLMAEAGHVVCHMMDGEAHVAAATTFRLEAEIASRLQGLARSRVPWDERRALAAVKAAARALGTTPSPSQETALSLMATHRVSVLTGGPGVGKTSVLSILVKALESLGVRVALAALAAQAAERMKEATGHDAKTIHLMLGANGVDGAFRHNARQPLEVDLVIIDEASMLDLSLAGALLEALPDHAAIIFAGDADQLRAVGTGRFLLDLIESEAIPVARLTKIHRQAANSLIVHNSRRILAGHLPDARRPGLRDDYRQILTTSAAETRDVVVRLASGGLAADGFGIEDIAVVSPQLNGEAGTQELNAALRQAINPTAKGRFAVGDRVMVTANNRQRRLRNGNVGIVVAASYPATVTVDIDGRRVAFADQEIDDLAPAYAVSVHKMQGSERRCVIVVLSNEHGAMLTRSLLMTAITRGAERAILVGQPEALRRAVANVERDRLGTLLHRLRAGAGGAAVAA